MSIEYPQPNWNPRPTPLPVAPIYSNQTNRYWEIREANEQTFLVGLKGETYILIGLSWGKLTGGPA